MFKYTTHLLMRSQEAFDGDVDVRTERAVCRLLLGDMDGAEAVLGLLAASNGSTGPDPTILAYIQVCCWACGCWGVGIGSEVNWLLTAYIMDPRSMAVMGVVCSRQAHACASDIRWQPCACAVRARLLPQLWWRAQAPGTHGASRACCASYDKCVSLQFRRSLVLTAATCCPASAPWRTRCWWTCSCRSTAAAAASGRRSRTGSTTATSPCSCRCAV